MLIDSDDDIEQSVAAEKSKIRGNDYEIRELEETKKYASDLFGDSDSEDEGNGKTKLVSKKDFTTSLSSEKINNEEDGILDSDEDDLQEAPTGMGRLQKKSHPKMELTTKGFQDSDDNDDENQGSKQPKFKDSLKSKGIKKRKITNGSDLKKSKQAKTAGKNKESAKTTDDDSSDEYDSGEEMKETLEDKVFIDSEDDEENIGVLKEYEKDNQVFDDERPDDYVRSKKNKAKAKTSYISSKDRVSLSTKGRDPSSLDPLTQTLLDMKKPKAHQLADVEKEKFVDRLTEKMAKASELDDICFQKKVPAVHKLQLLSSVQQAVSMKALHQTLLDRDILNSLRDWIEPRDKKTLPALSLRTAVYEMLLKLPCLPDHLKRVSGDKPPVGATIVSLRKHKMETESNKRLLRELMEKWSRPIFSKSIDEKRGQGGAPALIHMQAGSSQSEIQQALSQKYSNQPSSDPSRSTGGGNRIQTLSLGSTLNPQSMVPGEDTGRVRVPISTGFLFTVQPVYKELDKRDVLEKSMGENRLKILKKLGELKGGSAGKKANPRAVDLNVTNCSKQ